MQTPQKKKVGKQYILHFIGKPSLNAEEVFALRENVNKKIQDAGGQIGASLCKETTDQLAYPIHKETRGYFCETILIMPPKDIAALADSIKHEERILRSMIEQKEIRQKKRPQKRVRKRPDTIALDQSHAVETPLAPASQQQEKREKISMEEIDRKLDEIIKNI